MPEKPYQQTAPGSGVMDAPCNCPVGRHAFAMSEDVYLCAPDGCGQFVAVHYCTSQACQRMSCCASEPGYGSHCCRTCADSLGLKHSAACDENWARQSLRIRKMVVA